MSERITGTEARVMSPLPPATDRITSLESRVMNVAKTRRKATSIFAQFMAVMSDGQPDDTGDRPRGYRWNVGSCWSQFMVVRGPNFEWIDMLINEVFPFDISFNSIGATRFSTDVTMVDSGHDNRNRRWKYPMMEYDVAYGVRTLEQLQGLIAFFRAMGGRLNAFLYHDYTDHASTQAVAVEARSVPSINHTDQLIGVGDGDTYKFQLKKTYKTPAQVFSSERPIYKPKPNTVQIGLNGSKVLNFTVDNQSGIVTFTTRLTLSNLDDMQISHVAGLTWRVTAPNADMFAGLGPGDRILMSGWVNAVNNVGMSDDAIRITAISSDRRTIDITTFDEFGQAESSVDDIVIWVHPAPADGIEITAGFYFYVPVRFDTDRLPTSLDHYGIGGAADVKLVEVRPEEE